jgi:hypothetical protein
MLILLLIVLLLIAGVAFWMEADTAELRRYLNDRDRRTS